MIWDREKLDAMVAEGWLRSQRHPDADLWIYNYTEKTQYENHWTPETLACRGLIINGAGATVARPFAKFFNYGTEQAKDIPAEPFTVAEKIDGSLGIVYPIGTDLRIATRGSFTSEQAIEGTAMLREQELDWVPGVTPLFEIIYPANRIVVDYGERRELVMIGAINNQTGLDAPRPRYTGRSAQNYGQVPLETLAAKARPNQEGFVVTFRSGLRVKVKFAEYIRLHRIVIGINARAVWESMRDGDDFDALLNGVPDEIYAWVSGVRAGLNAAFNAEVAAALAVFDARPSHVARKTMAEYFLGSGVNPAVLFRMLDGKSYDDVIWKTVRPEPLTPTTAPTSKYSEETDDG